MWYNVKKGGKNVSAKWWIKVSCLSTIQSALVVSTFVLGLYLINFNHQVGVYICSTTGIPEDTTFTMASFGFLNNIVLIMWLIEIYILKPYFKFINKCIMYLFRFA